MTSVAFVVADDSRKRADPEAFCPALLASAKANAAWRAPRTYP